MKTFSVEQKVEFAIKRVEHILKYESNNITGVFPSGDGTIILELSNGMNFHLTSGEMEYRAEEYLEQMREMRMDDVIDAIADDYIRKIKQDMTYDDVELLESIILGKGMKSLNLLSTEELENEYFELFGKKVKIIP
jgi:hypothetical protein